jgi:LysM repeat protein
VKYIRGCCLCFVVVLASHGAYQLYKQYVRLPFAVTENVRKESGSTGITPGDQADGVTNLLDGLENFGSDTGRMTASSETPPLWDTNGKKESVSQKPFSAPVFSTPLPVVRAVPAEDHLSKEMPRKPASPLLYTPVVAPPAVQETLPEEHQASTSVSAPMPSPMPETARTSPLTLPTSLTPMPVSPMAVSPATAEPTAVTAGQLVTPSVAAPSVVAEPPQNGTPLPPVTFPDIAEISDRETPKESEIANHVIPPAVASVATPAMVPTAPNFSQNFTFPSPPADNRFPEPASPVSESLVTDSPVPDAVHQNTPWTPEAASFPSSPALPPSTPSLSETFPNAVPTADSDGFAVSGVNGVKQENILPVNSLRGRPYDTVTPLPSVMEESLTQEIPPDIRQEVIQQYQRITQSFNTDDPQQIKEGYIRLSNLYFDEQLSPEEQRFVGKSLNQVAGGLYFSPKYHILEPPYTVRKGDTLESIAREFHVTPELLMKINNLPSQTNPLGMPLKVIRGPLEALINSKTCELMILNQGHFVCRFRIGVGLNYAGQKGNFTVQAKLVNPVYDMGYGLDKIDGGNPENPLGCRWIKISEMANNIGIHGTNRPDLVGYNDRKMVPAGVFFMKNEDIIEVCDMLVTGSKVIVKR